MQCGLQIFSPSSHKSPPGISQPLIMTEDQKIAPTAVANEDLEVG